MGRTKGKATLPKNPENRSDKVCRKWWSSCQEMNDCPCELADDCEKIGDKVIGYLNDPHVRYDKRPGK
jgi:hypothetical protein